jgi:5-methylcytosine-specific restriction endonuclease McrA
MRNRWVWITLSGIVLVIILYGWSLFPSFDSFIVWIRSLPTLTRQLFAAGGLIVILVLITFFIIRYRILRQLRTSSEAYKNLLARNANTTFYLVEPKYHIRRRYDSKAKLDRTSMQSVLEEELLNQLGDYENLASHLESNQKNWKDYLSYFTQLMNEVVSTTKSWYLKRLERLLLQQKRLPQPVIDVEFLVLMTYTSPKGRNHYEKKNRYGTKDFILQLQRSKEYLERISTQEYLRAKERSKMSTSMRFKILKRDQFRCQICGASQEDGAKMHIDHIVPVAKGGKTIESNLHVLCDRCNLGKGTKGL